MRTIKCWDPKQAIRLKSIDPLWKRYCKQLKISPSVKPSLSQATDIFVLVIKDFKRGSVSLDELSGIGSRMFGIATQQPGSDFFETALSAAELSFAVRAPAVYRCIEGYLQDIDWFYDVHTGKITQGEAIARKKQRLLWIQQKKKLLKPITK